MSTETTQPVFQPKLIQREEIAEDTMAFHFERPAGWTFKAGQSVDLTLNNPSETDAEGNTRAFSIASAPSEDTLMFATRMRNTAFKRVLKTLPLGTPCKIDGPFGDLKLHNNASKAAVFLCGGIGITPVRSILVEAAASQLPHRIFLFFSNHRRKTAPFFDEVEALQAKNSNYRFIPSMTDLTITGENWSGETGYLSSEMLRRHLQGVTSAIYYVTGPAAMVSGMRTILHETGVDDDDIRVEEFSGY